MSIDFLQIKELCLKQEEPRKYISLFNTKEQKPEIPKSYAWCPDCELLTPHIPARWSHKECLICGNTQYTSVCCPECNWEMEDNYNEPTCFRVTVPQEEHDDNKYPNYFYKKAMLERYKQVTTVIEDTPDEEEPAYLYVVYTKEAFKIYKMWSHPIYSMDCSNAVEWGAVIICPICGTHFDYEDGNC